MDCLSFSCDESLSTISKHEIGLFSNEINNNSENHHMFGDSQENDSNCGIDLKLGAVSIPSKSTPFCKVVGCNKNLTNCTEYHKRHKVCEAHTKSSKVIVNGIEQRFCQQCSRLIFFFIKWCCKLLFVGLRFHLLLEFDDGKRSCRKRLAGHNKRRRKPHMVTGNEFKRSTGSISSFMIPYDHRIPYHNNGRWKMNLEDRTAHDLQSISCITDEQLHSKSLSPCNFETNPRFDGIVNVYMGPSCSETAHSLLSYQSQQNTWCYSSRINPPSCHPMLFHYEPNQDSVELHQHGLNPMLGVETSLVKFGIMSSDDQVFSDQSGTIDLLQLSSQLERVERQKKRNSQVNPGNGVDVGLGMSQVGMQEKKNTYIVSKLPPILLSVRK